MPLGNPCVYTVPCSSATQIVRSNKPWFRNMSKERKPTWPVPGRSWGFEAGPPIPFKEAEPGPTLLMEMVTKTY